MKKQTREGWTGGKTSFRQIEEDDLQYWLSLSAKQRLSESFEWNKKVWAKITGKVTDKMEMVGAKLIKNKTDQDDF